MDWEVPGTEEVCESVGVTPPSTPLGAPLVMDWNFNLIMYLFNMIVDVVGIDNE